MKRCADVAFGHMSEVDTGCSCKDKHVLFTDPISYADCLKANKEPDEGQPPPYQPLDQARSVWTNPFTLPSKTVNGLYKGKSGWSTYIPT